MLAMRNASLSGMRHCVLVAVAILLQVAHLSAAPAPAFGWTIHYQPTRIVNGSPVIFRVTTLKPVSHLTGDWLGHELAFSFDPRTKTWFALAGASLETKPGSYPIQLHAENAAGQAVSFEKGIPVARQRYPRVLL